MHKVPVGVLGASGYAAAYAAGQALSWEAAVAEAQAALDLPPP